MDSRTDVEVSPNRADAPLVGDRGERPITFSPESGPSTEDRLAAMVEMIRNWDWRSSRLGKNQSRAISQPPLSKDARVPTTPWELQADPQALHELWKPEPQLHLHPPVVAATGTTATVAGSPRALPPHEFSRLPIENGSGSVAIDNGPLTNGAIQPELAQRREYMSPAATVDPLAGQESPVSVESDQAPQASPHRFGRLIIGAISIAIVIVILIVIRLTAPSPTSGSLTPSTVTSSQTTGRTTPILVSNTVKTDFVTASTPLDAANITVTKALSGSNQTVAQVAQAITPYVTALNNFDAAIHTVPWPASMQPPSEALLQKTQALITFMTSINSVNAATLSSWVTQLRTLATDTQVSDNALRKDVGVATTTNYP
jgi:hypothetical protein